MVNVPRSILVVVEVKVEVGDGSGDALCRSERVSEVSLDDQVTSGTRFLRCRASIAGGDWVDELLARTSLVSLFRMLRRFRFHNRHSVMQEACAFDTVGSLCHLTCAAVRKKGAIAEVGYEVSRNPVKNWAEFRCL